MAVAEAVKTYQNLIGGEWKDARNGATLEVYDPGNGELVYRAPNAPIGRMTTEEILAMYEQAQLEEDLERLGIPPRR